MIAEAIMCSLNEERYIGKALDSVLNQTVPVKITLADSGSTDGTVEIARGYNINILDVPRGKLNARDAAIRNSDADIIIALDADNIYPSNYFETVLWHFEDPEVVAVNFLVESSNFLWNFPQYLRYFTTAVGLTHIMIGGASAFLRQAYLDVGGFNLSIDQSNLIWMVSEEEHDFGQRLSEIGKYVFDNSITVKSSSRRIRNVEYTTKRVEEGTF